MYEFACASAVSDGDIVDDVILDRRDLKCFLKCSRRKDTPFFFFVFTFVIFTYQAANLRRKPYKRIGLLAFQEGNLPCDLLHVLRCTARRVPSSLPKAPED